MRQLCSYCAKRRAKIAEMQGELAAHEAAHTAAYQAISAEVSQASRFIAEFMALQPGQFVDFPRELVSYERVANWAARARRAVPYRIACRATELGARVERLVQPGETTGQPMTADDISAFFPE